jgi:pyruvate dehydrogenase E2 component (dihydrolipoamide acetyltransferase)
MAYKIVMPQLGLTMEEGTVTSWLKNPGEWVEKGEILFTVETDKVEMEVESMGRGYLGTIQVPTGETVPVGTLIAMLNDEPETAGG